MSTNTDQPIGVGIIGASPGHTWATLAHLPALSALPSYRLVAVSTTKQSTRDETARRFDVPHAFDRAAPGSTARLFTGSHPPTTTSRVVFVFGREAERT